MRLAAVNAGITWQNVSFVIILAAVAMGFVLMYLYAAEGHLKNEEVRDSLKHVTMALIWADILIFFVAFCVIFVASLQATVTQIHTTFTSPLTSINLLERLKFITPYAVFIGMLVVGVLTSFLFDVIQNDVLRHVIGSIALVLSAALVVLDYLNKGLGHFLDWYNLFISAPLTLFVVVMGIVAVEYVVNLVFRVKRWLKGDSGAESENDEGRPTDGQSEPS